MTEDKQANCGEGQSAKTQRTNPARHRDISTEQQQQQEKGEARQLWPTVGGTRRGCAACLSCAQIAAWVRARACVARPCKSQPCDVILVTQEMRVRETAVSLYAHRRHSRKDERSRMGKRCVMQLPCLRPALAAAAVQYSSICRQSAEWWRKRRRRMRMASGE